MDRSDIIERIKERQQQNQKPADSGRIIDLSVPQNDTAVIPPKAAMDSIPIEGGEDTAKEMIDYMHIDHFLGSIFTPFNRDAAKEMIDYMHIDPSFNPKDFINGAKEAFPMIVEAFSRGDLKTLKMLLSDGVYTTFEQAIEDRKNKGETLATDVHVVKDCKIMGIKRIDRMAYIKLRFLAEETIVIRDREGNITHGNPDKLIAMNDVWTFGRDMKSKDPTWYLYETSDDVPEELKNPVPDSN